MPSVPQILPIIARATVWTGTTLLVATPAVVAADFGGTLSWTLWATSITALAILALLIPVFIAKQGVNSWRYHSVFLLLLVFATFGFVQSISLPHSILRLLAGGSSEAYSQWLQPLWQVPEDAQKLAAVSPKISVDISLTRAASWTMVLIAIFAGIASSVFPDRSRLRLLMTFIALSGAIHAGLGIYQMLAHPDATVWGIESFYGGKPFGAFVNRSNAAVMLNIGLAGSIGLIAWRLAALTGATLTGDRFPLTELLDVIFDRISGFAIATAALTTIGLLTCGSRSGLAGMVAGLLLAFGIIQKAHRPRGMIATLVGVALIATIAIVNFDLSSITTNRTLKTIESATQSSAIEDARFTHWPDGFAAGISQPLVGWGWGAYRYAYLPFQKTSEGVWFINADNLWLEVFVETGLVGILIITAAFYLIVRALRRLDLAADPIDHGLASMGWFLLGSLLVSQFFDFGLRIPANSLAVALVFSAVIARSLAQGAAVGEHPHARSTNTDRFRISPDFVAKSQDKSKPSGSRLYHPATFLSSLALLAVIASTAFSSRAFDEAAVYQTLRSRPTSTQSTTILDENESLLRVAANKTNPRSETLIRLSQVNFNQSRLRTVNQLVDDGDYTDKDELLAALSPAFLRRFFYIDTNASNPIKSDEPYWLIWKKLGPSFPDHYKVIQADLLKARATAIDSLLACPLSPEARMAIISLDFAGGSSDQSIELLKQAAILRKQNPDLLLHIGDLAAEMKQYNFAASSWKRAAFLSASRTASVVRRSQLEPEISTNDVVPDSLDAVVKALTLELRRRKQDAALIDRGIRILNTNMPLSSLEKTTQYMLIARLQASLGKLDLSAKALETASAIVPRDANIRFEYANTLMLAGNLTEARVAARKGREIAPDDARFERLIQLIAKKVEAGGI